MNKQIWTIFILLILSAFHVFAGTEFKDMIVTDKYICRLTPTGEIKFYDKLTGQPSNYTIQYDTPIMQLTTDKLDNLVIVDINNAIKKYNEKKQTWGQIATVKPKLYGVLFNSKNQCFVITDEGMLDVQSNEIYFSGESLNHQIHYKSGRWGKPYCYYMDKFDKIWIGFGYGEWGGDLFIFDAAHHKFLIPDLNTFDIELSPVKSFFEDGKFVYLSSGLQHMMSSGEIIKFDNLRAKTLFRSDLKKNAFSDSVGVNEISVDGAYIGPAAYNKFDNSIYFYSQNGFFKGAETKDLSKIENWQNILKPKLHWKYGQPDAVGSPMNVLKLIIIEKEKFVFLTQNDGIGFYDGKKLTMLK
jgi:hypothetical protein